MRELSSPVLIKLKAALFLVIGLLSGTLLILDNPSLRNAMLLALTLWSFCRCYYFAFYVIEHYVDPSFRFSGLLAFARYLLSKKHKGHGWAPPSEK